MCVCVCCDCSADDSDAAIADLNAEFSDQRPSSASSLPASRMIGTTVMGGSLVMADGNGMCDDEDVYSEITHDTDCLIKDSSLSRSLQPSSKSRRNVYASNSISIAVFFHSKAVILMSLKRGIQIRYRFECYFLGLISA